MKKKHYLGHTTASISVKPEEEFTIDLKAASAAGYEWNYALIESEANHDDTGVKLQVKLQHVEILFPETMTREIQVGTGCTQRFHLLAGSNKALGILRFSHERKWENPSKPIAILEIAIIIS